ncbi:MAG: gamma-glutamyltransferase [Corynebacteriales bacterium]|nr:gamma-glutamyltransferase [Mycobacteriales bacterium]
MCAMEVSALDRITSFITVAIVSAVPLLHPTVIDAAPDPANGAVASIDANATAIGTEVLRNGGNAVDAAVATAAALGVTDPFSSGIGGGGFFVYYDADTNKVHTLDGRETAPGTADHTLFLENGAPIPFTEAVSSGLGVGTPGTPMTWHYALEKWGTHSLSEALAPAEKLARKGFTVDSTFAGQIENNAERFSRFPATAKLYLPGGKAPAQGSNFKNPDLARTYHDLRRYGITSLYRGDIGRDIVKTVNHPQSTTPVRPGLLTEDDLGEYEVIERAPVNSSYRGLDIYGMAPPSSGTTTVGEALNIIETFPPGSAVDQFHRYLEASRLAFADRNRWVGDPEFVEVPTDRLLSQEFANTRACLIKDNATLQSPVAPGDSDEDCDNTGTPAPTNYEGKDTTHLTVADKWGNVVSYTLTIEQEGGSGMVVPGRGFILNNELTDFSFAPANANTPDPNLPGPSKRPRSSMAPLIVFKDGQVWLAIGSPGGATIITTVLQIMIGRVDQGLSLTDAIAAPRASQRNAAKTDAEPAFMSGPLRAELESRGQVFTQVPEIGAATGVEKTADGNWIAAAEPTRRGGGSAVVVP